MNFKITDGSQNLLLLPEDTKVKIAGRVVFFRHLGSVAFGKLEDQSGRIQFSFNKRETPEKFKDWVKATKIGSIIHISGRMWTSTTGEKTILVDDDFQVLRESLHPFPNKKDGIVDPEVKLRKRYLDIILNPEVKDVFKTRTEIIRDIRRFLESQNFLEIETPILSTHASGAQARPFSTHHNAYDAELYMRIAPETYLKRAVAASLDNVFEIGKNFRNEGTDPSHLQEFTSLEWYSAYHDYRDNLRLFQNMLTYIFEHSARHCLVEGCFGSHRINSQGTELNFTDIPVRSYEEVFEEYSGISPWEIESAKEIDVIFKTKVRPNLIQPIFLIDYPAHMSPLAQRSEDGKTVEQWQFIVNGWELVKCYTELTDPVLQRKLLEEQMNERANGDEEAMMLEEDFLECMEYGMPPCSGVGVGIDRLVAILTNQKTLRDVILFPMVL